MIFAGLAFLAFGLGMLFKAIGAHRSGLPYVFSFWDGGLLLQGRQFRARSVLIFALAYLVGVPLAISFFFFGGLDAVRALRSPCRGTLDDRQLVAVVGPIRQK